MQSKVLLCAICTLAARHLTSLWYREAPNTVVMFQDQCLPDLDGSSAIHYHNACLALLKDFNNTQPDEANAEMRADALAATTLLRTYEQLDSKLI